MDNQYTNVCKDHFESIGGKLDRVDEAIRGNGKPGILTRLDRLEQAAQLKSRFHWFIAGSLVGPVIVGLVMILLKVILGV